MSAPAITTSVYKYKPYAPWMLGAYCIVLLLLFFTSPFLPSVAVFIAVVIFMLLPVYAALKPKSIFSIRSVDERMLSIDAENIIWGGLTIPVKDVAGLSIYLFAFQNFRHSEMGVNGQTRMTSEFGDQNKLDFVFQGKEYDFTFFLADYVQYQTTMKIISVWKTAGYKFSARSAFDYSYIQDEVAYYGY